MKILEEDRIKLLIDKYLSQSLTEEESHELDTFIKLYPSLPGLLGELENTDVLDAAIKKMTIVDTKQHLKSVLTKIHRRRALHAAIFWAIVLSIILFVVIKYIYHN